MHKHVLLKTNCSFFIFDALFQKVADELQHDTQIRTCAVPSLVECLRYGDNEEHYAFEETWNTAADDTFVVMILNTTTVELLTSPWQILHTSGSTGMPKPVTVPQSSIAAVDAQHLVSSRVGRMCQLEILAEADMPLLGFPLFHTAGLILSCFLLLSGCTLMLGNPKKPVSRNMVREIFKASEADAALLPPSVLEDVAQDEQLVQDLSRCRYIMFGGGM
jgi:acyl-CoA synthetase (AMP-forming)/AMP-acid ligase II